MITLYELHWSHYCEKIRWALDYKKIPWGKINICAFSKKQMKEFAQDGRYLVPFIVDDVKSIALGDSSPILRYLDENYFDSPIFPQEEAEKEWMYQALIELDTKLGIAGRRLGYSQIILENPGILAQLFVPAALGGVLAWPYIRRISGAFLGMLLIKRFRFELNESLNLYEELEQFLLSISQKLMGQKYLVNNAFSALDLTLAVYLRPLRIIPFFKEHPKLAKLFEWQEQLFLDHDRESELLYENLIKEHRRKHLPYRRRVRSTHSNFLEKIYQESKIKKTAYNDQENVWTWRILLVPYYYFFKMRENKVRQRFSSRMVR